MTQLEPGCSGARVQASASKKSPLVVMLEKVSGVVPLLVTVTLWIALTVPTACAPKARLEADRVTVEVLPVKFITWGLPGRCP